MGTEFETDKNYNYEREISMNIELPKTCYSKGEIIQGTLSLFPKTNYTQTQNQLINPYAVITLEERHFYQYTDKHYDSRSKTSDSITREEQENIILFTDNLHFQSNMGLNISNGLRIPFAIKIPNLAYPSCIFERTTYVKHFLSITFPSIDAKKTEEIIIKNNIYFSNQNGLLKSPIILQNEITKHKYIFFNYGSFKFSITLPKNFFSYDESVQFILVIDSPNLSFNIKGVKVSLNRIAKKNYRQNHQSYRSKDKKEIISKYIALTEGDKHIHIEDNIKLPISPPEFNPKAVYTKLDNDKRKHNDKFGGIKLYPTCFGGLLSCEYFIKFVFDMDAWFTTNEELTIPLDFYEIYNDFNASPKNFQLEPYTEINNNQIKTGYSNTKIDTNDEELPDEEEINAQKNNKNNFNYEKPGDDNNFDGDAPPPSAGKF